MNIKISKFSFIFIIHNFCIIHSFTNTSLSTYLLNSAKLEILLEFKMAIWESWTWAS